MHYVILIGFVYQCIDNIIIYFVFYFSDQNFGIEYDIKYSKYIIVLKWTFFKYIYFVYFILIYFNNFYSILYSGYFIIFLL